MCDYSIKIQYHTLKSVDPFLKPSTPGKVQFLPDLLVKFQLFFEFAVLKRLESSAYTDIDWLVMFSSQRYRSFGSKKPPAVTESIIVLNIVSGLEPMLLRGVAAILSINLKCALCCEVEHVRCASL